MPLSITKKDGKFCVTDPAGKQFGCHATKKEAVDQIGAIESSKAKSAIDLAAADRIRVLAAELDQSHGTEQPPIMILSDGTPEGTALFLHGQPVDAKRLSIYCSRSEDYPHCDVSITMEESDDNGMIVEKTLTLRKEPPMEKGMGSTEGSVLDQQPSPRGIVVLTAGHPNVTDNKDHFPINDADQARNALARVAALESAPKWWNGSLRLLQRAARAAVKRQFPSSLNVTEANSKEGFALYHATGSFRWIRRN